MSLFDIPNFVPLTDELFTSGQPTQSQFADLAREGVALIINLALSTSTSALVDEAGIARSLGIEYIHIPVDWEHPKRANLEQFMEVVDAHRGQKILVHCVLNYRASAFTALWRIRRQGWPPDKALEVMHKVWNPGEYPAWKAFIEQVVGE